MLAKRASTLAAIWLAVAGPPLVRAAEPLDDGGVAAKPAAAVKTQAAMRSPLVSAAGALVAEAAQMRPTDSPLREPALAQAIGRAGKQGIVERSVEAYTEVLIQCQQNRSPILTVPFQRSDSQQAHCYRF
jgi:hypothetical protein